MRKIKQEKGIAAVDILIAVIIIELFAAIIISGVYQSYLISAENNQATIATSYAIQFLEYVDKTTYDNVTVENLNSIRDNSQIDSKFNIQFVITNYQETHPNAQDLVKTVTVTVQYEIANKQETIEISKVKVKE